MASHSVFPMLFLCLLYQIQFIFLGRGLLRPINNRFSNSDKQEDAALLIVHHNDVTALAKSLSHFFQINLEPGIKVYVLDDHSDVSQLPDLKALCQNFNVELVHSEAEAGKKKALAWFLPSLKEEYIIQTDADCEVDEHFLNAHLEAIYAQQPDLIVGQVRMRPNRNIWSKLAALDHLSLQLVTFSSLKQNKVLMAAGASMAYKRESFIAYLPVGEEWAGGEDTFVAQAMAKANKKVLPLPKALVYTDAPKNFKHFIKQRLRWGAKSQAYPSRLAQALALNVALLNFSLVIGMVLSPFLLEPNYFWTFFLLKIVADAILLYRYTEFYGGASLLRSYLILALLYPFYICLVVMLIPFSTKGKWLSSS